jgi:hypothetical protein
MSFVVAYGILHAFITEALFLPYVNVMILDYFGSLMKTENINRERTFAEYIYIYLLNLLE